MKLVFVSVVCAAFSGTFLFFAHLSPARADASDIYRCGHEFLNDASVAKARNCSRVDRSGAVVTVPGTRVQSRVTEPEPARPSSITPPGARPAGMASFSAPAAPRATTWRTDSAEQRLRDRDALSILQAELGKAEALLAERKRELANPQRQTARLPDLQASISRHASDIASLKREISRLPNAPVLQSK